MQFDEKIERRGTNCAKWDTFDRIIGIDDLIHVGCADMDFRAPKQILDKLHAVVDHGVFGYSDLFEDFYDSIIRFYKVHHKVELKKEHIVFCPRINIACGLCAEAFTDPHEEVLIHSPSYPPLRQAIEENTRHLVEVHLYHENNLSEDGKSLDICYKLRREDLEKAVSKRTRMVILVNPHNPTTRVFTKEELTELAEFCLEHNLILFADEIHSDLLAKDVEFTSVLNLDEKYQSHIIMASSPAKTFNMPGLVGSFLVISDKRLREGVKSEISRIGEHNPNVFFNAAISTAYTVCDDYISELRPYIDDNAALIKDAFNKLFPKAHFAKREGSYLMWIDLSEEFSNEDDLRRFFFEDARVGVYLGEQFSLDCKLFIRFNLGCPKDTLYEVIKRITNAKNHKLYNA